MKASILVNPSFPIGTVDPRLFSGFIEHVGRAVYEGIYEPGHPEADEEGFRRDVLALVRELAMPLTRYPGGNFVSGYDWREGVGPRERRPTRLDLAWKSLESNHVGTDDFVRWCRKAGTEPMLAVNLGTAGPAEAAALVEYCNFPGGTDWSDRRRANGAEQPHGVKVWCLGNEMDGPWQTCARTATEYGRVAREAGKLMKGIDPSIELVVCGSSSPAMAGFGAWEREVLEEAYDIADYLSLHIYFEDHGRERPVFFAQPDRLSRFIEDAAACCDAVGARRKSDRRVMLSVDEWNVWYHSHATDAASPPWTPARHILEDTYDMADVVVVGGMLNALLNHADRVRIGCLAQTVNAIAPIRAEKGGPAWRQTIYHPFQLASRHGRGAALRQVVQSPVYEARMGHGAAPAVQAVPYLSSAAVWRRDVGEVTLFAMNRSLDDGIDLDVRLENFAPAAVIEHVQISHPDLDAVNGPGDEKVRPEVANAAVLKGQTLAVSLAPASWNMVRVAVRR